MKLLAKIIRVKYFNLITLTLFILCVLFVYLFFRRETSQITVTMKITDENVLYAVNSPKNEFSHGYIIGDTEKDELGRVVAEITNVRLFKTKPEETSTYITLKIKTIYNPRKNQHVFRGKTVAFGESFALNFSKVRLKGVVVDFSGFDISKKEGEATIKTQLRHESRYFSDTFGVPLYIANALKEGDIVKDSLGNELAVVKRIEKKPAQRLVITTSGEARVIQDPLLWDVFYTLKIKTTTINNVTYMYDYDRLEINAVVPLFFDKISIWPTIIEIIEQR